MQSVVYILIILYCSIQLAVLRMQLRRPGLSQAEVFRCVSAPMVGVMGLGQLRRARRWVA